MAKRKTIRVNPLDSLVPNPKPDQTGKPKVQSARPAAASARTTTRQNYPRVESSATPAPAMQFAQPTAPGNLISRIESLESQNVYITWLVGGGILLLLLL